MKIIEKRFSIRDLISMKVYAVGDFHFGSSGHDLNAFQSIVNEIKSEPTSKVIVMGDCLEAINMHDKRFSLDQLADWMGREHLKDIVAAQRDYFLDVFKPIAPQCIGVVCGNHESAIQKWYERDIYHELVTRIKEMGGMKPDEPLALGYSGWLVLRLSNGKTGRDQTKTLKIKCHHGFTGGRLAGSKALNMQRELWYTDAHIVLNGHSHNLSVQPEVIEKLDAKCNLVYENRFGCFTGSFLKTATEGATSYSEVKGYPPLPIGCIEIDLRLTGTIFNGGNSGMPWYTPRTRVLS